MKKRIVYITLTLSMFLGGYSFYEVKNSTNLLLSENIEALSAPGDTPDEAILISSDYKYVDMYKPDPEKKGYNRVVYDNDFSDIPWADKNWYKDRNGHTAKKCRAGSNSSLNETWGHCFK